ncbi:septin-8 [Pimephales promelas]|nr:septin-8 [Pimephales promelas]
MKKLDSKVNIIPIIAKADTISKSELHKFKIKIMSELVSNGVQIYQFPTDDEAVTEINSSMNAHLPFAVVGSVEEVKVGNKTVRARQYPWGVVQVENESHCDFVKLREMLIRVNMEDLREQTHARHYELYRRCKLEEMGFKDTDPDSQPFSLQETYEAKRKEFLGDLQRKEEEMRQMFVNKVKETEGELKEKEREDWFAAIDLKDAYFHVSILPRHRPFLRFAFEGQAYQYAVLPFGLALSPRVFTKIVEAALVPLREHGVRILNYLDDWLILAHSRAQLCEHRDLVLRHLARLGLRVNREKSKLCPVQRISFLGMEIDSVAMSAQLTNERARTHCWLAFVKAPGAYGIRGRGNAARFASYETASAVASRSSPEVGMASRLAPSPSDSGMPANLLPVVEPQLFTDRCPYSASFQTSRRLHGCIYHGLGCHVQWACSRRFLDRSPSASCTSIASSCWQYGSPCTASERCSRASMCLSAQTTLRL